MGSWTIPPAWHAERPKRCLAWRKVWVNSTQIKDVFLVVSYSWGSFTKDIKYSNGSDKMSRANDTVKEAF